MKVVLITSQQNRRSGTAYTFEQLIFKVCVTSWASSCWPGAFFLWKFKEEALSKFWGSFICHQIKREREDKVGLHILKQHQRPSWWNCRDFWDTRDARDVPETQECLPGGPGLPCQFCESHQKGLSYKAYCFQSFVPEIIYILLPFLHFPTWTELCACFKEPFVVMIRVFELADIFTVISNCSHKQLASFLCFRRGEHSSE